MEFGNITTLKSLLFTSKIKNTNTIRRQLHQLAIVFVHIEVSAEKTLYQI